MFFGLDDLSPDLFFDVTDDNIYLYLKDVKNMLEVVQIVPLESFGTDNKIKFKELPFNKRLTIGLNYLKKDAYAKKAYGKYYLKARVFETEFYSLPKLIEILKKYGLQPNGLIKEFIPVDDFYAAGSNGLLDLYYIITAYFSSTYREIDETQLKKEYSILTDSDLDLNKFQIITKISDFFFREFKYYLATNPKDIPFCCDFGTNIRKALQSKNTLVLQVQVENEINKFINDFNAVYDDLVHVEEIKIESSNSRDGSSEWTINILAKIEDEYISFKLIKT